MTQHYHSALMQKLTQQLKAPTSAMHHVFSYTLAHEATSLVLALTLQQQETDYRLSMTMHCDAEYGLRVYQFTLHQDEMLEDYCVPLHDAALIHLVLQALNLLFHCASYWRQPQITCMFPADEAEHILYFDRFFDDLPYDITPSKVQIPAAEQDYEEFRIRTRDIQIHVYQALWQLQKTDDYLRRFLQTPDVRQNLKRQETPPPSSPSDMGCTNGIVLAFPRPTSRE